LSSKPIFASSATKFTTFCDHQRVDFQHTDIESTQGAITAFDGFNGMAQNFGIQTQGKTPFPALESLANRRRFNINLVMGFRVVDRQLFDFPCRLARSQPSQCVPSYDQPKNRSTIPWQYRYPPRYIVLNTLYPQDRFDGLPVFYQ